MFIWEHTANECFVLHNLQHIEKWQYNIMVCLIETVFLSGYTVFKNDLYKNTIWSVTLDQQAVFLKVILTKHKMLRP